MRNLFTSLSAFAAIILSSFLSAQDNPVKPVDRSRGAKLQQACAAMTKMQSVAFATTSTATPGTCSSRPARGT